MAGFSVTEAALTGFRVVREHPKTLIALTALQLVLVFGTQFLIATSFAAPFARLEAALSAQRPDSVQVEAALAPIMPLYGATILLSLILAPVLYATMNRAVLRPQDDRFGYVRLGADELRQLGLVLLYTLLGAGIAAVLTLATGIVNAVVAAVAGDGLTIFMGVLNLVLLLAAWLIMGVRFSLASAQTFVTGRVNLIGSWALTRGRFWPILQTYLLAFVLFIIVTLLTGVVSHAAVTMAGGVPTLASLLTQANAVPLAAYFSPGRVIELVLDAAFSALALPLLMTPSAAIYQALTADQASA